MNEINELVLYLRKCDEAYYNSSNPLIDDATYDATLELLRRLDPNNPYLLEVGAPPKRESTKIGRRVPMGTLSKFHEDEEIQKWLLKEDEDFILISPKYDGFAVELAYSNGNLVSASTRGDGYVGEDVLLSVMKIHDVPLVLSPPYDKLSFVRGEVVIPRKNHKAIEDLGYSAMRNAVPGIVRSNRTEALMLVDFVAYEFFDGDTRRDEQRKYYSEIFNVEDFKIFNKFDFDSMKSQRELLGSLREKDYPYELDGVVLKTNTIKSDDLLNPSHMIAWKYRSNRKVTKLLDVEYQLGVTGYFNPVGIFEPVEFQGAILQRASLGNMVRLSKEFKGMTKGSLVEVSRRGDIIPYIESLVSINDEGEPLPALDKCPYCGEPLEFDGEPCCNNDLCPEILRLRISQFVRSVGVKGIGDKLVRSLIDNGFVKSIEDIYRVDPEIILSLPRQGESSKIKWIALQDKKLSPLELLSAYPFVDIGKKVWEVLLKKYTYLEILDLTKEDLTSQNFKGIGDAKIDMIVAQINLFKKELLALGEIHGVL